MAGLAGDSGGGNAFDAKSMTAFKAGLNRVYTFYTGGFLAFVIVLAILEQMGLSRSWIGFIFLLATIGLYAGIGIMSRTTDASEYYVAGRRVPALYNGMATGADWMSAASFIGMAGTLYLTGYGGLAFIMGWTGGYCLVALFLAPYLRKFGQFTIPDFPRSTLRRQLAPYPWHSRCHFMFLHLCGRADLWRRFDHNQAHRCAIRDWDFPRSSRYLGLFVSWAECER